MFHLLFIICCYEFISLYKQNIKVIIMIHQHNHSTQLRYMRTAIYYPPTGTGRDTYIMTNNGGTNVTYQCQGVPQLGNFMKFGPSSKIVKPASFGKFQKYASDGTGRDNYVVSKHGGQVNQFSEGGKKLDNFRQTLRDGGKSNGYETVQKFRVTTRNPSLSFYQERQASKLSVPKRNNQKYQDIIDKYRRMSNI